MAPSLPGRARTRIHPGDDPGADPSPTGVAGGVAGGAAGAVVLTGRGRRVQHPEQGFTWRTRAGARP
ncbi:hypothetical protein R0J91_00075 [Micrococcus sp. SIMBA_131]